MYTKDHMQPLLQTDKKYQSRELPKGFLAADSLPPLLPSPPILTRASACWRGLTVQHYRHPPGTIDIGGLIDHLLVIHLSGPVLIEQLVNGQHERGWGEYGRVSITPRGTPVRRRLRTHSSVVLVHIPHQFLVDVAAGVFNEQPFSGDLVSRLAVEDDAIAKFGKMILFELQSNSVGADAMVNTLARAIGIRLLQRHSTWAAASQLLQTALESARLKKVLEYMSDHLDGPMPLSRLSRLCGVSKAHFSRMFREASGESPHRYLVKLRIDRARSLLTDTDLSIVDVGLQCGFEQATHFATMFRKLTGVSPRGWRVARR